jgi:transposase
MPAPISMDLRLRIVRAVERGSSIRAAAQRVAVSPSAAIKLMQRVGATAAPHPRYGGYRRPLLAPHEADLLHAQDTTPSGRHYSHQWPGGGTRAIVEFFEMLIG